MLPADSPRLDGEDEQHTKMLADADAELPPILVHRETMRIVDGMHRVRAAMLRGEETIRATLFDGSVEAAFVAAVEANIKHGLPLSLADREAAAARIVASNPLWSDRAIALVSGISAKTVCAIRRGVTADSRQSTSRIGRDGRIRPVNGADGRRRACEFFQRRPNASLREVAREAGISPGTARDVRARMSRGEDPVRPRQSASGQRHEPVTPERQLRRGLPAGRVSDFRDRATLLRSLRRDPTVRFTNNGRSLLRWLESHAIGVEGWAELAPSVPPHCGYVIADLACAIAEEWLEVAESVRGNAERQAAPPADEAAAAPLNGVEER
ncbi:ParB N-terminal domain-containing protein [Solihabitans fulvus]|uniref:ParB N-terminal domain-containing protein n=1 Tax=Solihabitans fulvus TaxID=1892852 RepID=UPI001CB768D3|nr:ParB N-terminal domain-containing protein [Solihabitans fulvus]